MAFRVIIAYATGFLTLSTFYRRLFDITDIGVDFFNPQYIHVGLIYFGTVLLIILPIFLLGQRIIRPDVGRRIDLSAAFLSFNFLLVFYGVAIFTPPGFAPVGGENWYLLLAVVVLTLLGLSGVTWFADTFEFVVIVIHKRTPEHGHQSPAEQRAPHDPELLKRRLRWLIVCVLVVIDGYLFVDIASDLVDMLRHGGLFFVAIILLAAFLPLRLLLIWGDPHFNDIRRVIATVMAIMIGALYYLSVLTFALFIFPYIPAPKGGGDFRFGGDVRIVFRNDDDAIALGLCVRALARTYLAIHRDAVVLDTSLRLGCFPDMAAPPRCMGILMFVYEPECWGAKCLCQRRRERVSPAASPAERGGYACARC